ncbi:MAG: RNA polymerase sigma factor region1.1 domain-containing protein, partial [Pseudomonadota bacterium]
MATKTKVQKVQKAQKPQPDSENADDKGEGQDGPVLDLSDAAVKKMIRAAKKRGYVTTEELNAVLPSEQVSSEQIEDTMAMLSDMGINVVEEDEVEDEAEGGDLVETT